MRALPAISTDAISLAQGEQAAGLRCADCRHRLDDRLAIEQRVSGLAVFGSAYGASIGLSRLCVLHDRLVSPDDRCGQFSQVSSAES
jgi:hypothetical protein